MISAVVSALRTEADESRSAARLAISVWGLRDHRTLALIASYERAQATLDHFERYGSLPTAITIGA